MTTREDVPASTAATPAPAVPPTAWNWPRTPLSNRYGTTVTEIFDNAADGRRVAVIEGAIWPAVGADLSVHEDAGHIRRGTVTKVELVLEFRAPARIVVWADLTQEPV
jgi:hypothetical protein